MAKTVILLLLMGAARVAAFVLQVAAILALALAILRGCGAFGQTAPAAAVESRPAASVGACGQDSPTAIAYRIEFRYDGDWHPDPTFNGPGTRDRAAALAAEKSTAWGAWTRVLDACGRVVWESGDPESRPAAPPVATGESRLAVAVRPTDLDSKGHANNARHLEYLQWGRWRWLGDRGLTDESLRAEGAVLVVARVEVDYRAEVRYGDTLDVRTAAARDGKKLVFRQEIRRPDGTLAAEAKVLMLAIDPATRKSRPLPESLARAVPECDPRS